jgi:hypothetical protein
MSEKKTEKTQDARFLNRRQPENVPLRHILADMERVNMPSFSVEFRGIKYTVSKAG